MEYLGRLGYLPGIDWPWACELDVALLLHIRRLVPISSLRSAKVHSDAQ